MRIWRAGIIGTLSLMLALPSIVLAKFGTNGTVNISFGGANFSANSIVQQPDGKLIAGGAGAIVGNGVLALARYNLDGSLDVTFGNNGLIIISGSSSDVFNKVIVQADGKIVAAGAMVNGGKQNFFLVRFNGNGGFDSTFGSGGVVTTGIGTGDDVPYSLIQQPDGKLVVAGSTRNSSYNNFVLVRYNSNGSADTTFGTGGVVITTSIGTNSIAFSLIQQPDGKLLAAGLADGNFAIARYFSNGSLDGSFGSGGTGIVTTAGNGTSYGIKQIIQQMDGKLVAVGDVQSGTEFVLLRYSATGILDTTFNGAGTVMTAIGTWAQGCGVIQQPDGKLVAAGWATISSHPNFVLARYTSNGGLDTGFGSGGIVNTLIGIGSSSAYSVLLQPDAKLAVAGTNGGSGFVLARYLPNGTLDPDTPDDSPLVTEIKTDHALAGQTVTLDIRGWNLGNVVAVQLRNAGVSLNASSTVITDTRITASFTPSVAPGLYDLYLGKSSVNQTLKSTFTVYSAVSHPVLWQGVVDMGKPGNPVPGPEGIAIGDADRDGVPEMYVANGDTQIYAYKNGVLSTTPLPLTSGGCFQDVLLTDMDLDGNKEVYGVNSYPQVFQYQWSGSSWSGNSFSAYSGPLAKTSQAGGGLAELYSVSGSNVAQTRMFYSCLLNRTYGQSGGNVLCTTAGDADNSQINEIYAAASDHKVYQIRSWGTAWSLTTTVFAGTADMTGLAIGDLDRDGANELYGCNADGKIYQFKWSGASWASQPINTGSLVANKITIGDGDGEGVEKLYAAGQDGHFYQFKWNGGGWLPTDLGSAGTPLLALAVGDGDGDGQAEVYGVGANGHVYQAKNAPIPPTPTPTATPTPAMTATPTPTASPIPLPDKLAVYCAPNPVRGSTANLNILTSKSADINVKIFTPQSQEVLSFQRIYPSAGKHLEPIFVGNLANGIYMVIVKAQSSGKEDRVVYKMMLIK